MIAGQKLALDMSSQSSPGADAPPKPGEALDSAVQARREELRDCAVGPLASLAMPSVAAPSRLQPVAGAFRLARREGDFPRHASRQAH